ncbi:MAG: hypothetical protein AAGE89_04975 [Pseudomonadota bacterium]
MVAFLGACGATTLENLEVAEDPGDRTAERSGSGVTAALILPLTGENGQRGQDVARGIDLALSKFPSSAVNIDRFDTGSKPDQTQTVLAGLNANGKTPLILSAGDKAVRDQIIQQSGLHILFEEGVGEVSGPYYFAPSRAESVQAAIDAVEKDLQGPIVVIYPRDDDKAAEAAASLTSNVGNPLLLLAYFNDETPEAVAQKALRLAPAAAITALLGRSQQDVTIAGRIVKLKAGTAAHRVIANTDWVTGPLNLNGADGVLAAGVDTRDRGLFEDLLGDGTGRASVETVLGFDLGAALASISNSGNQDVTIEDLRTALQRPTGFRGAAGPFRFKKGGTVERAFGLYQIKNGRFEILAQPPESFQN